LTQKAPHFWESWVVHDFHDRLATGKDNAPEDAVGAQMGVEEGSGPTFAPKGLSI